MSQINCGILRAHKDDDEFAHSGKVSLGRRLSGVMGLREHPMSGQSKKAPDYEVFYKHEGRQTWGTIGAAWNRVSEDGRTEFISMSLDNPDWDGGLNMSAFKNADGELNLVWSRPRGARVQDEEQAA